MFKRSLEHLITLESDETIKVDTGAKVVPTGQFEYQLGKRLRGIQMWQMW
jgi:hypothetical protein